MYFNNNSNIPQMKPFSQRPCRTSGTAAAEAELSLVEAAWTRAGSDLAEA